MYTLTRKKDLPKFRFEALNEFGKKVSGVEMALTSGAANLALCSSNFQPLEMNETKNVMNFEITKKEVPRKEVATSPPDGRVHEGGHPHYGSARGH